jgi:hypothetical protein
MLSGFRVRTLSSALLLALCFPQALHATSCESQALAQLRTDLNISYKNWELVTLEKLRHEDAEIWKNRWGSDCPGVAQGNFDHSGGNQYAVLLLSQPRVNSGGNHEEIRKVRLLHAVENRRRFKYRVLDETITTTIPVVRRLPPGNYEYYKPNSEVQKTIVAVTELVLLEAIEASSYAYMVRKSMVHKYMLSY